MFNRLLFEEIFHSLKQYKLRNILTGFGVAWGIFILIILLGAGEGLHQGVMKLFGGFAQNSFWVYGGQSSINSGGQSEGKQILFTDEFIDLIKKRYREIENISVEYSLGDLNVIHRYKSGNFSVIGINKGYFKIKLLKNESGRLFNVNDFNHCKHVAVIGEKVKKTLFPSSNAIGNSININDSFFKVIGVLESGSIFNQNDQNSIFLPAGTINNSLSKTEHYTKFGFTLQNSVKNSSFEFQLKKFLARNLRFNPLDEKAIFIFNFEEQVKSFNKLFTALKAFLWFIGVCFLISGMVGIGNIMLIIVKERTKEIGIRKAIGATPKSIIQLILLESVVITVLSGLIGMISGIGIIQLGNLILNFTGNDPDSIFTQFTINIPMSIGALILLIITGCLAGLIPAKKAVEILPAKALNYGQM